MFGDDGLDLVGLVEVERVHQPCEPSRHALGIEARQQVTVECGGRAEIGAEIPVVPAVVPAEGHMSRPVAARAIRIAIAIASPPGTMLGIPVSNRMT
jgi:hypothetical protein